MAGASERIVADKLESIGATLGRNDLVLDADGYCVIAISEGNPVSLHGDEESGLLTAFAQVGQLDENNIEGTYNMLLDANFQWRDTAGATLGVDPDNNAVLLAQYTPVEGLDASAVEAFLVGFGKAVEVWRERMLDWEVVNRNAESNLQLAAGPSPENLV